MLLETNVITLIQSKHVATISLGYCFARHVMGIGVIWHGNFPSSNTSLTLCVPLAAQSIMEENMLDLQQAGVNIGGSAVLLSHVEPAQQCPRSDWKVEAGNSRSRRLGTGDPQSLSRTLLKHRSGRASVFFKVHIDLNL